MGILHVLAELKEPSMITLGDVTLRVGESDRDAAVALLAFTDKYIEEGKNTYADAEAILLFNLLVAVQEAIKKGIVPPDDRDVRTMLDCLWWFRFLVASRPEDEHTEKETPNPPQINTRNAL